MPNPPAKDAAADSPPAQEPFTTPNGAAPAQRNVMAEVIERHERVTNRVKNGKK